MTKTYTVVGRCSVELSRFEFANEIALGLMHIEFEDAADTFAVYGDPDKSDDGEFGCWDAGANFENGTLVLSGADGPSGGTHTGIRLVIAQHLITKLEIGDE